jgi:hypothetical protein
MDFGVLDSSLKLATAMQLGLMENTKGCKGVKNELDSALKFNGDSITFDRISSLKMLVLVHILIP